MMKTVSIRRGRAGTMDTLKLMALITGAGAALPEVKRFSVTFPVSQWDSILRDYWEYQDEEEETLRSVRSQIDNLARLGKMIGDCDDAAIVGAAIADAEGSLWQFVAVRQPNDSVFSHVFVEVATKCDTKIVRIDPTAPVDADYLFWERMVYP